MRTGIDRTVSTLPARIRAGAGSLAARVRTGAGRLAARARGLTLPTLTDAMRARLARLGLRGGAATAPAGRPDASAAAAAPQAGAPTGTARAEPRPADA